MRTVAVVDDATVIRESLPALMPRLGFAGGWSTIEEMLAARPIADALVLDLHLSNASQPDVRQGVAAIRAAVSAGYRVCVFSQEERRFVLAACLAAGASGVVSKSAPTARAEEVITAVAEGEVVVPPSVIGLVEVLVRRNSLTILSERQRQVLAGRARGLTYAEMSSQLHLSESTLRGYWAEVSRNVSEHFQRVVPAELEHALGLGPGDLLEYWPDPVAATAAPAVAAPAVAERRAAPWWRLRPTR